MFEYQFLLPCTVTYGKNKPKKVSLTLNWFRNAHFQTLNNIKQSWTPNYMGCVDEKGNSFPNYRLPKNATNIAIRYTLWISGMRRTDVMNWISVVDKFFLDYLVNEGVIEDDNLDVINSYIINGKRMITETPSKVPHTIFAQITFPPKDPE